MTLNDDLMLQRSIFACGFAAARCGKAPPFRCFPLFFEAMPHESEG